MYKVEDNTVSDVEIKTFLACAIMNSGIYMGSPRRRNSLPEEIQLKRIAKAQLKRERKQLLKGKK